VLLKTITKSRKILFFIQFFTCFIIDPPMQQKKYYVNLTDRNWRTWKMDQITPTYFKIEPTQSIPSSMRPSPLSFSLTSFLPYIFLEVFFTIITLCSSKLYCISRSWLCIPRSYDITKKVEWHAITSQCKRYYINRFNYTIKPSL
jgi:hypothetical protein